MGKFERREYKYAVPIETLDALRERFLKQMDHDPFCRDRSNGNYCVRSIYFDSPRLLFYHEKIDGLKIRKKLRVRVYNDLEQDTIAFLEIKRKIDNIVFKERARLPLYESVNLLNGVQPKLHNKTLIFSEAATLEKFLYLRGRLNLQPKVLVTYEREALIGIDDPYIRVTFDMNIRSHPAPLIEHIFHDEDLIPLNDRFFILEVKFYGRMPVWIRNIVRDFRLHLQAFSKYCEGIDACYPIGKSWYQEEPI